MKDRIAPRTPRRRGRFLRSSAPAWGLATHGLENEDTDTEQDAAILRSGQATGKARDTGRSLKEGMSFRIT